MQPENILQDEQESRGSSPYLLWGIWLMWLPFLIQPVVAFAESPPSLLKVVVLVGFGPFVGVYLWATWEEAYLLTRVAPVESRFQRGWWIPLALLLGLSLPAPFLQGSWGLGALIFVSASVAARLTVRQAVLVFGGLMLLDLLLGIVTAAPWVTIAFMVFLIPAVGATTATFSRAFRTNRELRLARREIARLAVSEERLRFARDLHDLLGHSLSLIALKSELADQLIPEDPQQARREVRDIEAAARTALQEVREAVAGYRQTTLANELQRARELLAAAGIRCIVQNDAGALPPPIETVLTWVVREGITNVIRHSRAKQCVISLTRQPGEICLTITDDGQGDKLQVSPLWLQSGRSGNGLRGMCERVEALGGRCEAGPADKQGFRLEVILPLSSEGNKRVLETEQARGAVE
ncbi:MAG TPA: sensor histidine kinase [Ktedonobacteraceae bacterium]|jgi:two-component system sensor histidine kinase DesK|nr:sensor histidine kinase [Ktedonobacteraceae bacterium]